MLKEMKGWLSSRLGLPEQSIITDVRSVRDQLQHNVKALSDFYLAIEFDPAFQAMQADMESFTHHCDEWVTAYQQREAEIIARYHAQEVAK